MNNPIAKITAAIILILSLASVIGLFGDITETGKEIVLLMVGASITFLFVSAKKTQASNTG